MTKYYAGIFLIAAATLLLEITLTRVFSVLFFHHFAFLIISTALFGFGLSGIYLYFSKSGALKSPDLPNRLSRASLLFAVTTLLVYKIVLILPYQFPQSLHSALQVLPLFLNYALLIVPFFFSGLVIVLLLSTFAADAGRLYGVDLAGASLGCLGVLWLVPEFGASGVVALSALMACAAALVFRPTRLLSGAACILALFAGYLLFRSEQYLAIPIGEVARAKQERYYEAAKREIEYSKWSPVSRIDVLAMRPNRLILLDGGSNVSLLKQFAGDDKKLEPMWNWRSVPYAFRHRAETCIIGPGGGEDVLIALSHRAESITAVEMDPLICDIVKNDYRDFIGAIYDHPAVSLLNDEGRSYLRRSGRTFDLIQQVHNISPMAIASGALNLSESYLLTQEAFQEYWEHLKPDGVLAINRWGILRAASIASVVLQENGIPDPQNYVIVTSRFRTGKDTSFYLKKGRVTSDDLERLAERQKALRIQIDYAPAPEYQNEGNPYFRLLHPAHRDEFIRAADLDLGAPTDNRPFFDHFQRFGRFKTTTEILPREMNPVLEHFNTGDMTLLTLLGEAAVLSFVFILLPAMRFRHAPAELSRWAILLYFSALGIGFILIEISLIQKHILFLGQPVYSISSVLFSLLVSAGAGSLLFQSRFKEGTERKWLSALPVSLMILLLFEMFVVPLVFDFFLGAGKAIRFMISGLTIAPLGIVLGIPFPLGLRILERRAPAAVPWAWGLNAYTTVVGSILCVIFSLLAGFRANFLIALAAYCIGILAMYRNQPQRSQS